MGIPGSNERGGGKERKRGKLIDGRSSEEIRKMGN